MAQQKKPAPAQQPQDTPETLPAATENNQRAVAPYGGENFLSPRQPESIIGVDPAVVAAAEASKARIQSAYIMALQKPRNPAQSRDRILHACKRTAFAEKAEYSKPIAGTTIKGPSIRLAELALREWGNILCDVQVLYEDNNTRRSRVLVIDLETNASFSKEIQVAKIVERKNPQDRGIIKSRLNSKGQTVFVVESTDDELHNKEAALISKSIRTEGLRVIPSDIIDEALDIARETLKKKDSEDPDSAKKRILDSFSALGIPPKDIQEYLGHALDSLTPKELQDLRGVYTAIKEGDMSFFELIKQKDEPKKPKDPPSPMGKQPQSKLGKALESDLNGPGANTPLSTPVSGENVAPGPVSGDAGANSEASTEEHKQGFISCPDKMGAQRPIEDCDTCKFRDINGTKCPAWSE